MSRDEDVGNERRTTSERPMFVNFKSCSKVECVGLCFDHHVFSDALPVTKEEIDDNICGMCCAREYCHVKKCSCFWKLQKEIVNMRERVAKIVDKNKNKCFTYKSELESLRSIRSEIKPQSFADEVLRSFGRHFQMIKRMESTLNDDFAMTLRRYEQKISERDEEIRLLKHEKAQSDIRSRDLKNEVYSLRKLTATMRINPY